MRLGPWIERAAKILDPAIQEQFVLNPSTHSKVACR
jgi:hypothetical protein